MQTTRNVEYLQIGSAVAATTTTITAMNAGEIGIFTSEGVRLTEATAATVAGNRFVIVTKLADGTIVRSPEYSKADMKYATRKVYTAATQQVDYIGYNGTSGSMDVINDNTYKIHIQVQELLRSNSDGRKIKFGIYKSSAAATQAEVASQLVKSLVGNFSREYEKFIKFTMLADHAGAATGAAADTVVGSLGSNKVVITDTAADSSVIALAAGDYFRAGTAVTSPIYKIVSSTVAVTGGTLTLDVPLQAAVNLVGTTAEYITAAQMAVANCGIVMTGQALSFKPGKFNDAVASWDTILIDFEDTTTTFKSVAATIGSGTINQVRQMEWFLQGFEGEYNRDTFSETFAPRTNASSAVAGGGYDLIRVGFETKTTNGFQTTVSPQSIVLAIPATPGAGSYAIAGTANDITDVLEILFLGAVDGSLAIS